ncbi:MAG: alpha/beta hydrolase [Trueperaceae bacterium]|nr:alpha/beta hydrolase [Trueperaceae bacterium]
MTLPSAALGVSGWLELLGSRCHYLESGTANSGPPLLLLHGTGLGGAALTYAELLPRLARHRHVFALDWPGYGASGDDTFDANSRPSKEEESDDGESAYSVARYRRYLAAFLERLALGPVDIVAFSMGAAVALHHALAHPAQVRRLVLIDAYGLAGEVYVPLLPRALASTPRFPGLLWRALRRRWFLRAVLQSFVFTSRHPIPDDLLTAVQSEVVRPQSERPLLSFLGDDLGWWRLRTDLSDRLADVTAPTLLIHGSRDLITPASRSRRAARRIPRAELFIVPHCGHWTPRQAPATLAEAIERFLQQPSGETPDMSEDTYGQDEHTNSEQPYI